MDQQVSHEIHGFYIQRKYSPDKVLTRKVGLDTLDTSSTPSTGLDTSLDTRHLRSIESPSTNLDTNLDTCLDTASTTSTARQPGLR